MTAKELKKLAAACRRAGIKSYSCGDFSFTLTDEVPEPPRRGKPTTTGPTSEPETPESDSLSPEALMFWSSQGLEADEGETQ